MKKPVSAKQKSVGRPATGITPMIGFRAEPELRAAIEQWAARQRDMPKLSEATRRLVELGLIVKATRRSAGDGQKLRAREMADKTIDRLIDTTAHPDDQATRKRRLIKGPEEFRDVRVDRPKPKVK